LTRTPVSIVDVGEASLPRGGPFDPPQAYPEAPYRRRPARSTNQSTAVREALRSSARRRPPRHAGVEPAGGDHPAGDHVVRQAEPGAPLPRRPAADPLADHARSIVRTILDFVLIALKGRGKLTVGDSPLQYADFGACLRTSGSGRSSARRRSGGFPIGTVDFRKERSEKRARHDREPDPERRRSDGYRAVELGPLSRFHGLDERCLSSA